MKTYYKITLSLFVSFGIAGIFWYLLSGKTLALLETKGLIAAQEGSLLIYATLLMLVVAIPVFILAAFFAWRYRASNTKAVYMPNWEHAKVDELIWWAIPFEIILVLGALTWISTHELDPHKPLSMEGQPVKIQAVALDWKWLFIYPEYGIASVNEARFPVDRQLAFSITADAPMNSFWIPQLGGQIYAMTGMQTKLHLVADEIGIFDGTGANYSGDGFSRMRFKAHALSQEDFDRWTEEVRQSPYLLNTDTYPALAAPSVAKVIYYGAVDREMFNTIIAKFQPEADQPGADMHKM